MRKINPVALSIIGGLFIFLVTYILFWVLFLCLDFPNSSQAAINILGNYFGGIASLWAAVIAAYLFNDWRVEKNYDLENQYLSNIVIGLRDIHAELLEMQDSSKQIKEVPSKIISYGSYLNRSRFEIKPALNKLDADVLIYSRLLNDKDLLDLLENLKGYCYSFENQYNQLIHKYYRDYLNKLNDYFSSTQIVNIDYKDKTSYERVYLEDERRFLSSEIKEIKKFFYLHKSCNANGKKISIDFLELADCSVGAINNFQDACIKKLRPKNET
ncbi:MAG: hypothetical protein ACK4GA_04900 [Acinetobacter sp.]|uniref:hypothetical protein n=1 Tax=Acinetobacter sp. TaxID=472 RepID=UPI00391CF343